MSKKPKHAPDWWLHEEILPPDPWAYIVSDFQWGWEILDKIEGFSYKHQEKPIGHYPDKGSRKSIEFALNTIIQLQSKIKNKISQKTTDTEFLWLWGEYQKALAILEIAFPEYQRTDKAREEGKKRSKEDARKWYALWYDWYKNKNGKGRDKFDNYFEKLISDIRTGEREIANRDQIDDVLDLAEKYVDNPQNPDDHVLTSSFRLRKFNSADFNSTLESAKKEKDNFPAVGDENYKKT